MKMAQIQKVIEANSRCKSDSLQKFISELSAMKEERELTKRMYFWSPSTHANGRRSNEKYRNIALDVSMKGLTIHYERDYSESCHYVYASDRLWTDEYESFTVRDISKLIDGLREILKERHVE